MGVDLMGDGHRSSSRVVKRLRQTIKGFLWPVSDRAFTCGHSQNGTSRQVGAHDRGHVPGLQTTSGINRNLKEWAGPRYVWTYSMAD